MAYKLGGGDQTIQRNVSLIETALNCYDTLDDDDFEWDRDFHLHHRSALELVREQLSDAQRAELDKVDAHWQASPKNFNWAFQNEHHRHVRKTALQGFVEDAKGNAPAIPRTHWWWHPIEESK